MKLFCYSWIASRHTPHLTSTGFGAGYAEAINREEAMGIALRAATETRSPGDGWSGHQAAVLQIKPEHIAAAAQGDQSGIGDRQAA